MALDAKFSPIENNFEQLLYNIFNYILYIIIRIEWNRHEKRLMLEWKQFSKWDRYFDGRVGEIRIKQRVREKLPNGKEKAMSPIDRNVEIYRKTKEMRRKENDTIWYEAI